MNEYYVYILRCSDQSYYTGVTNNYERRVAEHQAGGNITCYTYNKRPVELVYVAFFSEITDAISFEKQVKGWSRKKKEALIAKEYEKLPGLAKKNFQKRKEVHECQTE